jgi:O-antigen ligase/tetratricopeptide (TPR) repeat protein
MPSRLMQHMPATTILPLDAIAPSRNRWDIYFEIVLGALLVFMPFALGAVEAWSELLVVAAAFALALGVCLRLVFDREFRPVWTWTYLPLVLFLAFITLQMVSLPASFVKAVSPPTAAIRQELLGPDGQSTGLASISMYPLATAHGLRLVLVGAAVFLTAVSVLVTPTQIKRLLRWILAVGTAQATLALLQIFTLTDRIHWSIDTTGGVTSGSFFNYSNFSQFMNLSIGAGLALLLIRLHEQRGFGHALALSALQEHGGLMAALMVCAISVFTSMSRNGVISLLVASAIIGTALFLRGTLSRRGWLLAMVPIGTLAVLLAVTFDSIYARMVTLQRGTDFAARWELIQGVFRAWRTFPIGGAGLGAHEFVFPMFDTAIMPIVAQHADNDYVELLEETGVVGTALVAAFLLVILFLLIKLCRRGRTPLSTAAFGLAFGLLAVAVHSATDFGQHLPAVFCLSAITCGLIVRLSWWEKKTSVAAAPGDWHQHSLKRWVSGAVATGCVALIGGWALRGGWAACRGETWRWAALTLESQIQADQKAGATQEQLDDDYADILEAAQQAVDSEPGNVIYGYWLNEYRWQAVNRGGEQGGRPAPFPREALPVIAQIADALTGVRRECPTYGPPYALEGLLRLTLLGEARGRDLIRTGLRLAPYDPAACMTAGEIAIRDRNADEAAELLSRAVKLQPAYFEEAASMLLVQLDRPDLAEQLAAGDYARFNRLAAICQSSARYSMLKPEFDKQAEAALREQIARGSASARELAALAAIEVSDRHDDQAIELYRQALALDYKQFAWRLALAQRLAAVGRTEEAIHAARICLGLRPDHPQAKQLIESLSGHEHKKDRN